MRREVVVAALSFALATPAFADKPREGKRKGPGKGQVVRQVRGDCPPGLAKKNNRCRPPGQAKKRYVVGQRLPRTVRWYEPSPVILRRYDPAPRGYRYVMVDDDLLLMELATRLIVRLID